MTAGSFSTAQSERHIFSVLAVITLSMSSPQGNDR